MRDESRRQLSHVIDHVAQASVARLRALAEPLAKVLAERISGDTSTERRKRLTGILAEVGRDWGAAVAAFDDAYRQQAAIAAGLRPDARRTEDISAAALTLVDDEQMEWDLAFSGAMTRMKSAGGEAAAEAGQRMSALSDGPGRDMAEDPVGLDVIGKGLRAALDAICPDSADRRALLVHFEPLFSAEVAAFYSEINDLLAARGIALPVRQRPAPRRPEAAAGGGIAQAPGAGVAGGMPEPAGMMPAREAGDAPLVEPVAGDFLGMLQRLVGNAVMPGMGTGLIAGTAGGSGPAGVPGDGAPPPSVSLGALPGFAPVAHGAPGAQGGVAAWPQAPLISGVTSAQMAVPMVPVAMIEALNRLQQVDLDRLLGSPAVVGEGVSTGIAGADEPAVGGSTLHALRQEEFVSQLPPVDVATIDVVAMLFDFIFEDQLIPDAVKALVGRLQIPLLKVAMADKSFFADREHPARLLLDTISKTSIAAGEGLDHGHPVFERIRQAINAVLTGFEEHPDIFETTLADLSALLAEQEKLAQELAERSRHIAEAQERDDLARTWTQRAFEQALSEAGEDAVPGHILDFLERHWTRVLKLAYLKGGAEGHPWALAVGTLNDLLWSVKPKPTSAERQQLVMRLPDILRRVNAYLDRVEVDAGEKAVFLNTLGDIHIGLIKSGRRQAKKSRHTAMPGEEAKATTTPSGIAATARQEVAPAAGGSVSSEDLPPDVVVTRSTQDDGLQVESIAIAGRVLSSRPVRPADIDNLERGDWVEFIRDDGERHRGRLAWVSPQRGILLFTNPHSHQAVSISPEALALQMRRGLASKLDASQALVDRALGRASQAVAA